MGGQGGLSGGGDITAEMQSEGEKKCWESVPGRRNSMCKKAWPVQEIEVSQLGEGE